MFQLEHKKHLIYILGTLAFFLFTIADTIIKLIGNLYKDTVIFSVASFAAVIPVLCYLLYRRSLEEVKTNNYKLHFIRGILMTLTYYFIVKGIILLPLSIAYPIILSAPVLLSLLGIIILKEKIYFSKIISLILAMSAVFLVSGFSLKQGFDKIGVLFLLAGVISLACLDFTVRVYGKSERTVALTFYSMLISGLIFFLFSINSYNQIKNVTPKLLSRFTWRPTRARCGGCLKWNGMKLTTRIKMK